MRKFILMVILVGGLACTPAQGNDTGRLERYLKSKFTHVVDLQGFYIVGSEETPQHALSGPVSAREAVIYTADIFAAMLDQNNDGRVDNPRLLTSLKKHLVFGIGYAATLAEHEDYVAGKLDHYMMSMKTDVWDIEMDFKKYEVKPTVRLTSSSWRPPGSGSIREEAYHTLTEAIRRYDPDWSFKPGSKLHSWMDADRRLGLYDTSEQNAAENGHYDEATAVNELIHQVWVFNQAGAAAQLSPNQKRVLELIQRSGLDLNVNGRRNGQKLYRIYKCTRGICSAERRG